MGWHLKGSNANMPQTSAAVWQIQGGTHTCRRSGRCFSQTTAAIISRSCAASREGTGSNIMLARASCVDFEMPGSPSAGLALVHHEQPAKIAARMILGSVVCLLAARATCSNTLLAQTAKSSLHGKQNTGKPVRQSSKAKLTPLCNSWMWEQLNLNGRLALGHLHARSCCHDRCFCRCPRCRSFSRCLCGKGFSLPALQPYIASVDRVTGEAVPLDSGSFRLIGRGGLYWGVTWRGFA